METTGELAGFRLLNEALKRRVEDLSLLFKISSYLHTVEHVEQTYSILLTAVTAGNALGFNRAFLFLANQERTYLEGVTAVGPLSAETAGDIWSALTVEGLTLDALLAQAAQRAREERSSGLAGLVRRIRVPLAGEAGVLEKTFQSRRPMQVTQGQGEVEINRELRETLGVRQLAAAPIMAREIPLGVLAADNLFTGSPVPYQKLDLLHSLASQAGIAIQNARTFANVQRRFQELQTLQEVSKGILSTVEIRHDLGLIARISAQVLGAAGSLVRVATEGEEEAGAAALGPVGAAFGLGERIRAAGGWSLEEGVAREVLRTGRPRLLADTGEAAGGAGTPVAVTALMTVPLIALDKTVGCLSLVDDRPLDRWGGPIFTEDDLRFLSILASQAAIAIANARLFEQVRRTERQLRESQALALSLEKMAALGQVTSRVAHEIRNPLAAIGGFARSVRAKLPSGDPLAEKVDIIVQESQRLEHFLENQLRYLHLPEPAWEEVELERVVEESLVLVESQAQKIGITLSCHLAPDLPPLRGDADQLKQVLLNLLFNALEGAGAGGEVELEAARDGDGMKIRILNSGPPIPDESLGLLFVPFFTTKSGGTGLGLPISREILTRHGGRIEVAREGERTVFTVLLPPPGALAEQMAENASGTETHQGIPTGGEHEDVAGGG